MKIRIINTPPGEAPIEIRNGWIGIELPLAKDGLQNCGTFGVLTGPKTIIGKWLNVLMGRYGRESGYIVEGSTALKLLRDHNHSAASWWVENTYFDKSGKYMFFHEHVCEVVNNG